MKKEDIKFREEGKICVIENYVETNAISFNKLFPGVHILVEKIDPEKTCKGIYKIVAFTEHKNGMCTLDEYVDDKLNSEWSKYKVYFGVIVDIY